MRNNTKFRFASGKTIFLIIIVSIISVQISNAQWVQVSNGMGNITARSLAYSGDMIFAGTSQYGIYVSTNEGLNWTQTGLSMPTQVVYSIAINGNHMFAGTGSGSANNVYLSTNNGINWSNTNLNQHVWTLAVSGNNIFAGTQVNGVYLSTNNGTNWIQTSLINSIISLAAKGDTIFAGTSSVGNPGVYVSTNKGANWIQSSLNNSAVLRLALKGNTVYAATYLNGLYWSSNNGTNWTPAGLSGSTDAIAFNGNTIFATVRNSGVYVSNNGGSWTLWNEGLGNRIMNEFCIFNNYIFLGTNNSVWRRPLSELTGIQSISNEIPQGMSLSQNCSNPFNPNTKIKFSIPKSSFTILVIYDVTGRKVVTLVNEQLNPGIYEIDWDGSGFSSGIYYYELVADEFIQNRKAVLIK